MDPIDILLRGVGLFYVLAGWLGLRAVMMDAMLDKAIAAISMKAEGTKEATRRRVLACFTVMIGASGAALALLSFWALPLFALNTALQAIWIFGGRRLLIDDDDAASRRQVTNAAILYGLAAAGVVWQWWHDGLGPWNDPVAILGIVVVAAGLTIWFLRGLSWKQESSSSQETFEEADDEKPERVLVDPAFGYLPLVNADTNLRFSHWRWLPEDIAGRIEEWDDIFQLSFDPEDVMAANRFETPEQEAAYLTEAEAIRTELGAIFGADNVAYGPGWYGADDDTMSSPA